MLASPDTAQVVRTKCSQCKNALPIAEHIEPLHIRGELVLLLQGLHAEATTMTTE